MTPATAPGNVKLRHAGRRGSGFSLIELMVVVGIIVLIAAAAMPAFRFITGARSTDSAANIASAMVARARNQALTDHRGSGVFFFLDPLTDPTTMALIHQGGDKESDPDFATYKGWTQGRGAALAQRDRGPRDANLGNVNVIYLASTGTQEASFVLHLDPS